MRTYRCLIVDDEELARRLVASYCDRLPQLQVAGQATNPLEAMVLLGEEPIDILFLDIQMPEMKGTDLLRIVRNLPAVILTTAYAEYALEGFDLDVTDYLLKPFSFERFVQAIHKTERQLGNGTNNLNLARSPLSTAPAAAPEYYLIKADHKIHRIAYVDISHIEGAREYVIFHTDHGKIMALDSLKRLASELPTHFLRVHKSYIVATTAVAKLEGNRLHLRSGIVVPIGGSYRATVLQTLFEN